MRVLNGPIGIAGALLALACCQQGCGRGDSLLKTFKTDALIRAAGAPQGVSIKRVEKPTMLDHNPEKQGIGSFANFDIKLSSGTFEQFLTNYQAQVTSCLRTNGATIVRYEPTAGGLADEDGIFRYCFTRSDQNGIVRVIWGAHAPNHYELIVIFSEGGKEPYW